ncbi:unnamed protein product [Ixodes persulcatus]
MLLACKGRDTIRTTLHTSQCIFPFDSELSRRWCEPIQLIHYIPQSLVRRPFSKADTNMVKKNDNEAARNTEKGKPHRTYLHSDHPNVESIEHVLEHFPVRSETVAPGRKDSAPPLCLAPSGMSTPLASGCPLQLCQPYSNTSLHVDTILQELESVIKRLFLCICSTRLHHENDTLEKLSFSFVL